MFYFKQFNIKQYSWTENSAMKKILLVVLIVIGLLALPFVLMMVASETGEVVVVTIPTDDGAHTVRLWVVDVDGVQYLRSGDANSGWYQRLQQAATVEVERNGKSAVYVAVPALELRSAVTAEMLSKYGWRDQYISWMMGDRESSIPIALHPAD